MTRISTFWIANSTLAVLALSANGASAATVVTPKVSVPTVHVRTLNVNPPPPPCCGGPSVKVLTGSSAHKQLGSANGHGTSNGSGANEVAGEVSKMIAIEPPQR